ncbi:MAG TPA: hypothetical protein VFC03_21830, partial [Acidimicrobiales bacterium]|nr:hypothetical protein [Acidimicrobiales bacterium]
MSDDPVETVGSTRPTGHPDDRDFIDAIVEHAPGERDDRPGGPPAELAGASVSFLPVAARRTEPEPRIDAARRSDVDEWGRSEHMRSIVRRLY